MKLIDFGSLNIDNVYRITHLVREGETIMSTCYQKKEGGKGFNQAVALARAGHEVYIAGAIGYDGIFLKDYLECEGVNTSLLHVINEPTGHAVIQVDDIGRNSIILFAGANHKINSMMIEETLSKFGKGDYVLLQNEINLGDEIIRKAAKIGMHVVLNPSPVTPELINKWPLDLVDWFILNEIEAMDITGKTSPDKMIDELLLRYPRSNVLLTLGEKGSIYASAESRIRQNAIIANAVDSTAAGDTFTGYFLHGLLSGECIENAMELAATASAIAVGRIGAAYSIPNIKEVNRAMEYS